MRLGGYSIKSVLGVVALIIGVIWTWEQTRTINQPDGQLAPKMPIQSPMKTSDPKIIRKGDWSIMPLQNYSIRARVLSRKRYRNDGSSDISPIDFALGWGPMSDNVNLDGISIKQRHRWFFIGDVRSDQIADMHFAANTHIIPADEDIRRSVLAVREGHVIEAEGYLVECIQGNNPPWRSSLSRTDTGDGACEVFYVNSIKLFDGDDLGSDKEPEVEQPAPNIVSRRQLPSMEESQPVVEVPTNEVVEEIPIEDRLKISAINRRGAIINGDFCRIGRPVSSVDGVYLAAIEGETVQFETEDGETFSIEFEIDL
ncbi:hypothetical protein [Rubellicoccus peritrichatus]|uniref:Uncharacterized protein n=1 Tax=Rubellicoccus peritrichatus TaxID=3080537 RepID=A0AAQ3QWA2_9BACT|nr:hypothetical protein [Puniceicoccus sp. CR14]WOO42468.1 hypothetical protein RZN69_05155 [Puniceicoccus sp. CR14]